MIAGNPAIIKVKFDQEALIAVLRKSFPAVPLNATLAVVKPPKGRGRGTNVAIEGNAHLEVSFVGDASNFTRETQ